MKPREQVSHIDAPSNGFPFLMKMSMRFLLSMKVNHDPLYVRLVRLTHPRKIFAGEQAPRVLSQGSFQWVPCNSGLRPRPHGSIPWQDLRSCVTLEVEVTLDYATGENYGQGKSGTALLGIRTPPLFACAKSSLRPRSIRVLRHWPFDPGGMTVYGLFFE
jgi:hypothetical protein